MMKSPILISHHAFRVSILTVFFVLTACGGSGADDDELAEIRLSSLSIVGYSVDFDPLQFGPYDIDVQSDVGSVEINLVRANDNIEWSYRQDSDGTTGTFDIQDDGGFTPALEDGSNIISIILEDPDEEDSVTYVLNIRRVSASASIQQYVVSGLGTESTVTLSPSFDEAILNYEATVPYTTCSVSYQIQTNREETITEVNGEEVDTDISQFLNLDIGDNFLETIVTSEDQSRTERYSIRIDRSEPTDDELEQDATIKALELAPLDFDFICGINGYSEVMDNNIDTLTARVSPSVDGVAITINGERVNSDQEFDIAVEDSGIISIALVSLDGSRTIIYDISYVRSNTNLIEVDSLEALQQALRNAQPNDEIRVEPGVYQGIPSLIASGDTSAHFFSDRSGTALNPIYLRSEDVDDDLILRGDGAGDTSVLKLTGSHWQISDIEFSNAAVGIELNGAHNIHLDNITVNDINGNGVIIRNAGTENIISNASFSDIGLVLPSPENPSSAAVVIGSDGGQWLSSPDGQGRFLSADHANIIRHSEFLSLQHAQAIRIEEGVYETLIEYNLFSEEVLDNDLTRTALIRNQGNRSTIHYNTFEYTAPFNLEALIDILPAEASWHSESWGEHARVYQNVLDLENRDIPFVRADSISHVDAVENRRRDAGTISYLGSGIDQNSFTVPIFHIRLREDERRCLGISSDDDIAEDEDNSIGEDTQFVFVEDCNETDNSQHWKPIVDDEAYVLLQNMASPGNYLRTVSEFVNRCGSTNGSSYTYLAEDELGFIQRWFLDHDEDGELFIRSKRQRAYGLTVAGTTLSLGNRIITCPVSNARQQGFVLGPVDTN